MKLVQASLLALLLPTASTSFAQDVGSFGGFYLGASVGFNQAGANDLFGEAGNTGVDDWAHQSPSGNLFGGYNFLAGDSIYGIEMSVGRDLYSERVYGRYGGSFLLPYPRHIESRSGGTPTTPRTEYTTVEGGQRLDAQDFGIFIDEMATPMLSGRIGQQVGNFMLYGKAGVGATFLHTRTSYDNTDSVYCTQTQIQTDYYASGGYDRYEVGCIGEYNGDVESYDDYAVLPAAALGIGLEYNFGQLFARAEAEARHVFSRQDIGNYSSAYTTVSMNGGLGVRF